MKPVEIEFLMRDKLTPGLDKAGQSAESLGDKAEKVAEGITERIAAQKEQIRYVENCLKELKKQYDRLGPGKAQMEMRAEIEACTKALAEDKLILASLEEEHQKTAASTKRLSMELRELLDAMARMRLEGKQNTREYQEMASKAATLSDTIGDLRTQTNILAHDDAGLQGVMSGVNGLSGLLTVATGIMGTFASENEDLIKIQTRVQSVMAITMGLQQVFNTLNKDSAFRLVTVRKAKDLLTAANTRLAVSLGISNAAATALMATLTLGLSLVVTGLVVAWNKYSDAQEKAAEKARELVEIESSGRARMVKTRFEIDSTARTLKEFTGTKEQERVKVEELNRKYGESFGYYNTIAEWYDVLIRKGEDYVQMLFLQAKAQALVDKAVKADEEVAGIEANGVEHYRPFWGAGGKAYMFFGGGKKGHYGSDPAELAYNKALKEATDKRRASLAEAEELQRQMEELRKKSHIGGFVAPEGPGGSTENAKPKNTLAEMEFEAARRIEDRRIDIIREGYEKERAEALLNFEREKERITTEEQQRVELYRKLKEAGEKVTPEQLANIHAQAATQRTLAAQIYDATTAEITARENKDAADRQKKREDELQALLGKYQDYEAQRSAIKRQGDADMAALEAARTAENGDEIDRAIDVAREKVRQGIQAINDEEARSMAQDNDFLRNLFGDYSSMSLDALQDLIAQARKLRAYLNGKGTADGLTFISDEQLKNIEASPAELDKLKKALDKLLGGGKGATNKWERIFQTFKTGISGLRGAGGAKEIAGSIGTIAGAAQEAGAELGAMLEQLGESEISDAVNGVQQVMGAVSNIGQGFAQGGIVGGIGAAVGEGIKFLTSAFAAEARHREALKEIERAKLDFQRQYNLLLLQQNLLMKDAESIFGEKQVAKAANAIEVYRQALAQFKEELQGDAPKQNFWEHLTNDAGGTYRKRLDAYNAGFGALYNAQIVTGHKKTGLFGWGKGKDLYSSILSVYPELIKANGELDTEMLRVILDTRKMSDETRSYLENLIELKDAMDEAEESLENYLTETFGSLGSGIMDAVTSALQGSGTALENFAANAAGVLENLGEQIAYSLFFADKFADLQEKLKSVYGSGKSEEAIANDAMGVIDSFYDNIGKNVDAAQAWMEAWKEKAAAMGFDLWKNDGDTAGGSQSARAGVYTAMSQEQGTKLEGLFTSVQMHAASIDETLDGFMDTFGQLCDTIGKILENVESLPEMAEDIHELRTNGIKLRSL